MIRALSINETNYLFSGIFKQALDLEQSLSFVCPYKMGKSWLSHANIRLEK
ncbi:hypothetical protein IMSAGC011_00949 [Lachnospiraceae bacterium]|nr:hypothetical protein IMSAGC011_00949 [Lachnospiraceae bacterium]